VNDDGIFSYVGLLIDEFRYETPEWAKDITDSEYADLIWIAYQMAGLVKPEKVDPAKEARET